MTGARREQVRAELLHGIPRWYSPWLHLGVPSAVALGIASVAFSLLGDVRSWQLACVPLLLLAGNALEWHLHRGLLHRRVRFLEALYQRHTPEHHAVFVAGNMAIRDPRELWLVLLPAMGLPAVLVATAPLTVALAVTGQRNLALLWVASVALQVLAHEWLHLACHLPATGSLGGARILAWHRRHHERHHTPHLMARWNLNVTLPVWDHLRGTLWRPRPVPTTLPARRPV